jgi:hypothetical protein
VADDEIADTLDAEISIMAAAEINMIDIWIKVI